MKSSAVYMTGNGRMAAAYRDGDFLQVFGPPYSSPSLFASRFLLPDSITRSMPHHLPQCGVWQIELQSGSAQVARITDFALPEEACLVRRFETKQPICMRLYPLAEDGTIFHRAIEDGRAFLYETAEQTEYGTRILLKSKNGNALQHDYPLPFAQFFTLLVRGDAQVEYPAPFTYDIHINTTAELLIIGGPSFPECDQAVQRLQSACYEDLLSQTKSWWHELFGTLSVFERLPKPIPQRARILQAMEDTVLNIVTQQSQEGGVLAGHAYHMGYVRDQFGVCMAMLKLGMLDRARQMLQFYLDVFQHSGKILNAQGLGVPGLFHFAENDSTEITGYLLLQFFRYSQVTGDAGLLIDNVDFLLWLYRQQLSQLHNGTLPFNGDETYIAGGLLPRDVINDGSAEATMLFLLSGQALQELLTEHHLADDDVLTEMACTLEQTRYAYHKHFVVDGQYTLNDPGRTHGLKLPQYRYGVCMNFGAPDCEYFGWTKLTEGEVYLCPCCLGKKDAPVKKNRLYRLPSALLMPAYLGSDLLEPSLVISYLQTLVQKIQADGHFYSNEPYKMNVGYDYGLLLYNLVRYDVPGKEIVCEKILSLLDEAGAWAEYYQEDQPVGTRYRAWESGINIDALLSYAMHL